MTMKLHELVERWRKEAAIPGDGTWEAAADHTLKRCADELSAALAETDGDSPAMALLRKYERWEGDWIMASDCWRDNLPRVNQALWDKFLELQLERNAVLHGCRTLPPEPPR